MANHDSFGSFARRIRKVAKAIPENADKGVRTVALTVDRTVVMATPKDTGRAQANWIATLNAPSEITTDATTSGNANQSVYSAYKGGDTVFIVNNLPYIVPLNNGHSKRAPAGFVHMSIDAALRALRKIKLIE